MKTVKTYIVIFACLYMIYLPILGIFCPTGTAHTVWLTIFYINCFIAGIMEDKIKSILT